MGRTSFTRSPHAFRPAAGQVLVLLWPVGVPLLYVLLLAASSRAILTSSTTPLSQATSFLWADYHPFAFFWEPLEMCRKLVLTGGVLIVAEEHEQLRVLVALVVSLSYLTLHLAIQPLKR